MTEGISYKKCTYNEEERKMREKDCRIYRIRQERIKKLAEEKTEENLWQTIIAFQEYPFKTMTGLPFYYKLKIGKNGEWNKELLIDRKEKSKSLAWSSVLLALGNVKEVGAVVDRPKALGDIRGITYIYGMFYRFGLIDIPEMAKERRRKRVAGGDSENGK